MPSVFFNNAVADTPIQVKSGVASVIWMKLVNTTNAAAYLQIFNVVSSKVALNTTPPYWVIPLAANESVVLHLNGLIAGGQTSSASVAVGTGVYGPPQTQVLNNYDGLTLAGTTTPGGNAAAAISVAMIYQ